MHFCEERLIKDEWDYSHEEQGFNRISAMFECYWKYY